MRLASTLLSLSCIFINFDRVLTLQMRPTRHATMMARNSTKLMNTLLSSTVIPGIGNSTDSSMPTTKSENEWNYGNKSLTTAKIIFICAFATILIIMLIVTVAWNWKTKRPVTREPPQEVMTQPATPNPEAKN